MTAGLDTIAEYDGSNVLIKRYVFDPDATDAPLAEYAGTSRTDRRWLVADERGSIVAQTDASGTAVATNSYSEYGVPGSANAGRFQYTGQMWFPELGLAYYKARFYAPTLGRFLSTDPIGYGDGMNWYNYVSGDPVNATDPSGMVENATGAYGGDIYDIVVTAPSGGGGGFVGYDSGGWTTVCNGNCGGLSGSMNLGTRPSIINFRPDIVVTARRKKKRPSYVIMPASLAPPAPTVPAVGTGLRSKLADSFDPKKDYCGGGGSTWPPEGDGVENWGDACKKHDDCYSPESSVDRKKCDANLRSDIDDKCPRIDTRCAFYGWVYYFAVRQNGRKFYKGQGNPE